MIRKSACFTLALLSITALLFAEAKLPASRSNEPIKIKSDQLVTDNARKMATFTGNVAARQGDLTIYSDKMVISYSDTEGGISSSEVSGNVRIIQGERRAQADHGVYDAKRGTIVLDGNPKVFQNSDMVSGKVITYYLDQEKSEVTSGQGSRVEAIIHPKGKGNDGKPAKP
jgi:lipopolysaccharide export system protein LptA